MFPGFIEMNSAQCGITYIFTNICFKDVGWENHFNLYLEELLSSLQLSLHCDIIWKCKFSIAFIVQTFIFII